MVWSFWGAITTVWLGYREGSEECAQEFTGLQGGCGVGY